MTDCKFICKFSTCRNNEAGHCSMDHPKFCPALNYCGACTNAICEKKTPDTAATVPSEHENNNTGIIPDFEEGVKYEM